MHDLLHPRRVLLRNELKPEGPEIACACGCGKTLEQFDRWGRERNYLPGHNIRAALKALAKK